MTNVIPDKTTRSIAGLPMPVYPLTGFTTFDMIAQYGTQALVTYYVYFAASDGGLELPPAQTISIVSAWIAMSLLGTVFTSWLVDRVIGAGLGLRGGALLSVAGYLILAFIPGTVGLGIGLIILTFSSALTLVCQGTLTSGVMKDAPQKREAGFTVYYLDSALGAFVGYTVSGFVQEAWGFQIGFLVSAASILIGLFLYAPFRRAVEAGSPPPSAEERPRGLALTLPILAASVVVIALAVTVSYGVNPATVIAAGTAAYAVVTFVRYFTAPRFSSHDRRGVARYLPFFLATVIFNLIFQQIYTTIAIHSEMRTDRFLFGYELPPATVLGVAPLCTVIVAPILAAVWVRLGARQPSLAVKFLFAFLCCGVTMGLLAITSLQSITPLLVLVLVVFVFGAADVVVSPSGMSLATELAPAGHESRLLSLHYVGISLGISAAGVAGEWYNPEGDESGYFAVFSILGFAVAVGMLIVRVVFGRRIAV